MVGLARFASREAGKHDGQVMAFEQRLSSYAQAVEARLSALLARVESDGAPPRLVAAMRHATLGGGKRFRPFLLIETARLLGRPVAAALDAATAVECLHCYSLVHDDLPSMDDDDLRRGLPTVHVAFDEATAILAGDALLTLAFEILADPATEPDAVIRSGLCLSLARASGAAGMVGGQILDLAAEHDPPPLDGITRLQQLKTGALIAAAVEIGAAIGRASEQQRRDLARYARALGLAFQITDDLLDAEGDAAAVGKATGKDAAAGKATFVGALGVDGARHRLAAAEAEALAALTSFGSDAGALADAVRYMATRRA
jgi:farnesyl diphosphate synthase